MNRKIFCNLQTLSSHKYFLLNGKFFSYDYYRFPLSMQVYLSFNRIDIWFALFIIKISALKNNYCEQVGNANTV